MDSSAQRYDKFDNPVEDQDTLYTEEMASNRRLVQTWTRDRQTKKSLVAHDITSLLMKASEKFGKTYTSAVFEKSGTELDDESFEFLSEDTIVMVLQPGETHGPPDSQMEIIYDQQQMSNKKTETITIYSQDQVTPSGAVPSTPLASPVTPKMAHVQELKVPPPPSTPIARGIVLQNISGNRPAERAPLQSRKVLLKHENLSPTAVARSMDDLGLVPFSDSLVKELREPTISSRTFQKAVSEAASFYFHHVPKVRGYHGGYDDAIEKIVKKYPSLEAEGKKSWTHFKDCFSQSLRKKRYAENKRNGLVGISGKKSDPIGHDSDDTDGENIHNGNQEPSNKKRKSEGKTKKPYNPGPAPLDKALLEEDDFKRHLDELIRVSSQGKKENERMANSLLKEIAPNLQKIFQTDDGKMPNLKDILEKYPFFKDTKKISRHFYTCFSTRPNQMGEMPDNSHVFTEAVTSLMERKPDDDEWKFAKLVKFIEKETDPKGKKGVDRYMPTLVVKKDVPPTTEETESALKTKKNDPPHIVAFKDTETNKVKRLFIAGNGTYITCSEECTIRGAYFTLMAVYFIFQLDYPLVYCGALGILQTYLICMGDYASEGGWASHGYKRLSGNLKKAIAAVKRQIAEETQEN